MDSNQDTDGTAADREYHVLVTHLARFSQEIRVRAKTESEAIALAKAKFQMETESRQAMLDAVERLMSEPPGSEAHQAALDVLTSGKWGAK